MAHASPCSARDTDLRLPFVLYLRLDRRSIVESPRFSHPSAVPVVKAQGCPLASRPRYRRRSGSELPRFLILRHRLITVRVTSDRMPSGSPCLNLWIAPAALAWLRRSTSSQVALRLKSLGVADSDCPGSPRNSLPRLIRICIRRLRLLPHLRLDRCLLPG